MKASLGAILFSALVVCSCMSAAKHHEALHSSQEEKFTLGLVQAKIVMGMSQTEVAQVLGSPNIVTKDASGDDSWVYDKIASEASYSNDRGGVSGLGSFATTPGSSLLLGGLLGNYSKSAGAAATTQRTLTVVIKFNRQGRVKDFSYHSSQF